MDRSAQVRALVARLAARHPRFPETTVERLVTRTFEDFGAARIQTFVPILVHRRVDAQLRYADGEHLAPAPDAAPAAGRDEPTDAATTVHPGAGPALPQTA